MLLMSDLNALKSVWLPFIQIGAWNSCPEAFAKMAAERRDLPIRTLLRATEIWVALHDCTTHLWPHAWVPAYIVVHPQLQVSGTSQGVQDVVLVGHIEWVGEVLHLAVDVCPQGHSLGGHLLRRNTNGRYKMISLLRQLQTILLLMMFLTLDIFYLWNSLHNILCHLPLHFELMVQKMCVDCKYYTNLVHIILISFFYLFFHEFSLF